MYCVCAYAFTDKCTACVLVPIQLTNALLVPLLTIVLRMLIPTSVEKDTLKGVYY